MVLEGIWGGDREGGPRLGHVLRGSAARTGRSPVCFFEPNLVKAKYAVIDVWGEQVSTLTVGMNVTDIFASQDDLLRIRREGSCAPQHGRPGAAGALRYDSRARPAGPPFRTSTGAQAQALNRFCHSSNEATCTFTPNHREAVWVPNADSRVG